MGLRLVIPTGLSEPITATSYDSDALKAFLEGLTWRADHPSPASCVFLFEEREVEVLERAMRRLQNWTPERSETAGKLLAALNPKTVSEGTMRVAIASMLDRSRYERLPPHMSLQRFEGDLKRYAAHVAEEDPFLLPQLEFLRLAFLILFLSSTSS